MGTTTGQALGGAGGLFGAAIPTGSEERWACDSTGTDGDAYTSDYASSNLSVAKPDGCFRISGNRINYLADYAIELSAKGSSVSWGSVKWKENPFKDLTCDSVMVAAADEVNVCALFEEEVDRALDAGWGGAEAYTAAAGTGTFLFAAASTHTNNVPSGAMLAWEAESKSKVRQFATVWYDRDDDGKEDDDIYSDTDDGSGTGQNVVVSGQETTANSRWFRTEAARRRRRPDVWRHRQA